MGNIRRLEQAELDALEREVAAGSAEAQIRFADDALDHYQDDPVEMARRKLLLIDAGALSEIAVLPRLCGLGAKTGDLRLCAFIVPILEGVGEPAFGFYCYTDAAHQGNDTEDWRMLLRSSAALGYLSARKKIASMETRERSVLLYPVYWAKLGGLVLASICIALKNPSDRRLSPWTRTQLAKKRSVR